MCTSATGAKTNVLKQVLPSLGSDSFKVKKNEKIIFKNKIIQLVCLKFKAVDSNKLQGSISHTL